MRHPYLIRLDEPEDWLAVHQDIDPETGAVIEDQHDILWPGGSTHWLDFFVNMKSLEKMSPEKYDDESYVRGVFERHECYILEVRKIDL